MDCRFCIETVDGDRMGRLSIPAAQVARWLNFLVNPQYGAEIVSAEQQHEALDIYFYANEGLYLYLLMKLGGEHPNELPMLAA